MKITEIKKGIYTIIAIFFALVAGVIGKEIGKSFFDNQPSQEQVNNKLFEGLNKVVENINSKCPMMVDKNTRMDSASVGPGVKVTYYYTFPNYSSSDIGSSTITNDLFHQVKEKVCVNPDMKPSIQYGASYEYSYSGNDNIKIASFEIDRIKCGLPLIKPK